MDIGRVIAAVVVLGVLGAVFGFVLAVASKVFEVKKDPREEEILSHLAGANCGGPARGRESQCRNGVVSYVDSWAMRPPFSF